MADRPAVPPVSFVKLLLDSMAAKLDGSPHAFGWALDNLVYVFPDRIQTSTYEAQVSFPKALGPIVAHKIGHALLGENSHARETIMSPTPRAREFQRREVGKLVFIKVQAEKMRERLQVKQAGETAVLVAQK